MVLEKDNLDSLINLCSRRGIIIPSFKIYGELAGFYDYGPIGFNIKKNIKDFWRSTFIKGLGNYEVESTIIGYDKVYQASGHIKTFTDPILKCKKCGTTYRADKMLETYFEGKDKDLAEKVGHMAIPELQSIISGHDIKCPKCKGDLNDIVPFNLMMKTEIGPTGDTIGYLRPETAQGIFVDFKELYNTYNFKLPIGIGQEGKVFRNEISPRQILIRMREFSQMELEYFFNPDSMKDDSTLVLNNYEIDDNFLDLKVNISTSEDQDAGNDYIKRTLKECLEKGIIPNKLFAYMIYKEVYFLKDVGLDEDLFRFRKLEKDELPHYSKGNMDLEVLIDGKYEEVAGNAYRSDFDLKSHSELSKVDFSVIDDGKKVLPSVVEVSFGVDRLFWAILSNNLYKGGDRDWNILILSEKIQPYDYAVFPLQNDPELIGKAKEVYSKLAEKGFNVYYKAGGSIGKRYAKADEIGVGKCVTIDYDTLKDNTVTVRYIKDATQVRLKTDLID